MVIQRKPAPQQGGDEANSSLIAGQQGHPQDPFYAQDDADAYPDYPADGYLDNDQYDASAHGHTAQLSQSFYNEAAAALNQSNAPTPAPYAAAPTAHLPTLLSSPYDQPPAESDEQGYHYAGDVGGYGGVAHDEGSPRSSYEDKDEVAFTPAPGQYATQPYAAVDDGARSDYYDEKGGYYSDDGEYVDERDEWEGDEENAFGQHAALDTQHFGPAPQQLLRRHKTKKKVVLTQGNLVLDCPVPSKLKGFLSRRGEEEFESMRYTAVTCDPDDFPSSSYSLRPVLYDRHTELFIAITLYNEDEVLLTRTLHGVFKNIAHLCSRTKSRTWGVDGWKKVSAARVLTRSTSPLLTFVTRLAPTGRRLYHR